MVGAAATPGLRAVQVDVLLTPSCSGERKASGGARKAKARDVGDDRRNYVDAQQWKRG
jgi:hypothetical protein